MAAHHEVTFGQRCPAGYGITFELRICYNIKVAEHEKA